MIPAELSPPDACPSLDCHPGDNPACLPLATLDTPEGTVAAYWHEDCGTAWAALFDEFGWPVERSVAPPLLDATGRRAA